jgi:hypothetical protein
MTTLVVTSFSAKGYEEYGKEFLQCWSWFWGNSGAELLVCHEGEYHDGPWHTFDLRQDTALHSFKNRHASRRASGREHFSGWRSKELRTGYSYRFDAVKFSHKVFAQNHASIHYNHDRLIWLDADVRTLAPITPEVLDLILPPGYDTSRLARKRKHTETGVVGYRGVAGRLVLARMANYYTTGRVFQLPEWHDCAVYDQVCDEARPELRVFDIVRTTNGHPLTVSPLNPWLDHLKGDRKTLGYSPERK